ncbi:MAG TPA: MerR family transcriptional regulator [Streptosporangiaceae bacterium]
MLGVVTESRLLRIGEFSRASWLSIKALRAYHEMGLLVPAEVDPRTGYRSYSGAQLVEAAVIRKLRQLDVPLDSIREVIDARDPAVTQKVLAEHAMVLDDRLAALRRTIDDLHLAVDSPGVHTPVHRRCEPARIALTCSGTVREDEFEGLLARSRALLLDAAAASGAVVAGSFGGCYPPPRDDDTQDVVAFLPVEACGLVPPAFRSAGVEVSDLPATDVAALIHVGDYEKLEDSYRILGMWVADHGDPANLPVREMYLVGEAETDDPEQYRTEICWPIKAGTGWR